MQHQVRTQTHPGCKERQNLKHSVLLNGYKSVIRNLEVRVFSEDFLVGFEGFNYMFYPFTFRYDPLGSLTEGNEVKPQKKGALA